MKDISNQDMPFLNQFQMLKSGIENLGGGALEEGEEEKKGKEGGSQNVDLDVTKLREGVYNIY